MLKLLALQLTLPRLFDFNKSGTEILVLLYVSFATSCLPLLGGSGFLEAQCCSVSLYFHSTCLFTLHVWKKKIKIKKNKKKTTEFKEFSYFCKMFRVSVS